MSLRFLPHIRFPERFPTAQELGQRERPLQFCPACNYVLCSCGNCHNSELCNEVCLHEQEEEKRQQS